MKFSNLNTSLLQFSNNYSPITYASGLRSCKFDSIKKEPYMSRAAFPANIRLVFDFRVKHTSLLQQRTNNISNFFCNNEPLCSRCWTEPFFELTKLNLLIFLNFFLFTPAHLWQLYNFEDLQYKYFCSNTFRYVVAGNPCRRGRLSTVDLLVLVTCFRYCR